MSCQRQSSADRNPAEEEDSLECGTSLAEYEHYRLEEQLKKQPDQQAVSSEKIGGESIASLRECLASDVVTDGGKAYTMVASPFRSPSTIGGSSSSSSSSGHERSQHQFLQLPLVYCDHTASNRPVNSIERYMEQVCLPLYGNTHTNTSITGSQTTAFVAEARQIVAEEANAKITGKASLDVVLFCGNGATSSVELLIDCLGLKQACMDRDSRPVVFIGPYEHHSNLIPWRESGCEIVMVPECPTKSDVDTDVLRDLLQKPEYEKRMKMGTFTAASNVTGKVCDVDRISATLHRHGALAFFDYATASSYTKVDMNPVPSEQYPSASLVAKDAVFISPHKMLGGVGTPGILIVKKQLVSQVNAPSRSGGGTVFYVTNTHHRFLSNRIERYEGGTPNVAGIVRVGLTFLLKRKAEAKYRQLWQRLDAESKSTIPPSIADCDFATHEKVVGYLKQHAPNLILLGNNYGGRSLPIFSFLIRMGERFLHYNYVCAILNDVFGIQSRGGCQCAGPYSQRLLGLTSSTRDGCEVPSLQNEQLEDALYRFKERAEVLRPGYTRLSLPFKGTREEEIDYVMKALVWVARNGWMLMCQYRVNHRTGEWRHSSRQGKPLGREERRWLSTYDFAVEDKESASEPSSSENILVETLLRADRILSAAKQDQRSIAEAAKMANTGSVQDVDIQLKELRWFIYPKECAELLLKGTLSSAPDKELGSSVLGALSPLSSQQHEVPPSLGSTLPKTETSANNRKRKPPSENDLNNLLHSGPMEVDEESMILSFRDGDYSGEATLREIAGGMEDGELSDLCEVFDNVSGVWSSIQSFIQSVKQRKDISQPRIMRDDFASSSGLLPTGLDQKKAPRTSATWGCAPLSSHVASTPACGNTATGASSSIDANPGSGAKAKRFRHEKPPPKIMRLATQAIMQWEMIKEGDRLLLGLSGGKDSLSLLHCLLEFQRRLPIRFEIEVCTIDPMTPSFDPSPLIPYVESLGLKYHYVKDDIISRANKAGKDGKMVSSLCSFCARMKRGNLYTCARKNNCNKLVLAQHLDDCAESMMMSIMHNGFLRTMKAHYAIDAGDISVIRPLVYCRESLLTEFAKAKNLPVINENCPACFEEPKERARVKKMLSREETLYPNFYDNMRHSLIPLMHDDMSAILRSYTEEVVARSRKKPFGGKKVPGKSAAAETEKGMVAPAEEAAATRLCDATDEELVRELARRKSKRHTSMKADAEQDHASNEISDPTGQVCTLNGGNGSIPCHELME